VEQSEDGNIFVFKIGTHKKSNYKSAGGQVNKLWYICAMIWQAIKTSENGG
jgi:hypothetical protein